MNKNNNKNKNFGYKSPMPSSEILEKFEDAVPGSVSDLVTMAKKEQNNRHDWQNRFLKYHFTTYRIGQFFGFIYNLALLYFVYFLIKKNMHDLALKIFTINAFLIGFIVIITAFERKIVARKKRDRKFDQRKSSKFKK